MNAEQLTGPNVSTFQQPALSEAKGSNVSSHHPSCLHKVEAVFHSLLTKLQAKIGKLDLEGFRGKVV
jgi:hypothetical protein